MQFTTVKSKEKDYYISLKSEKKVHSNQEFEKNACQLFGSGKNWFLAISSLTKTVAAIWRERKVDPCYLETKKCSSQLLRARKKIMTSIYSQKNWFTAIRSTIKMLVTVAAIWRERKVDNLETTSSQLLGARKKIMTSIYSQKNWFTAIRSTKKMLASYLEKEKTGPSYFEPELQLFGEKVDPCYLETKKCSSQLLGARKKIITSIFKQLGAQKK